MCKLDVLAGLAEMKDVTDHAVVNQHNILYSFFKRSAISNFAIAVYWTRPAKDVFVKVMMFSPLQLI